MTPEKRNKDFMHLNINQDNENTRTLGIVKLLCLYDLSLGLPLLTRVETLTLNRSLLGDEKTPNVSYSQS